MAESSVSLKLFVSPPGCEWTGTKCNGQLMKTTAKRLADPRRSKARKVRQPTPLADKLAAMSDREIARLLRASHRLTRRRPARRRAKAPNWTPGEDRLLGKWPDKRVARFLGRTLKGVEGRRLKLGIRFCSPPPPWTPEEERLLDPAAARGPIRKWTRQLARQLGRSVVAIRCHRRLKYGAVCSTPRRWTQRELRLLGTRLDREVAGMLGRTCGNVQVKRCSLGLPSYRARHKFRWTAGKDRLLGTESDRVLAERFGCYRKEVESRRHALGIPSRVYRLWTPEEERLVGTMRDEEVARRIGRTRKSVGHRRRALEAVRDE